MTNFHCVVDASALIKKYHDEPGTEMIKALFEHNATVIYLLNIAIAEVLGTFLRLRREGEITPEKRNQVKADFLKDITSNKKIVIHNISDRNVKETENVWGESMAVPRPYANGKRKKKRRVGTVDVFVLSVCQELNKKHGQAYLFSSDEHMLKVAEKLRISAHNPQAIQRLPF